MNGSRKRIAALSKKEFLHIVKDPRTLLIVFLLPLVQLVLFGYSFNMEIDEIALAVLDRDNTTASRHLIELFTGSDLFRVMPYEGSTDDTEIIFKKRTADALLVIPPDFERQLLRGLGSDVQVLIDPNTAVLVRTYFTRIVALFETDPHGRAAAFTGGAGAADAAAPPFEIRTSILYNPDLESSFFFVPGIVAMIMVMICALLTSITVAREKETGTMEQILVSPIKPREIIAGKVLPYILLAFLDGAFILLVGIFLFGVPFRGNVLLMAALSTLYVLTALSLGLMISTRARTQQVAIMFALVATMLPTFLLSGLIFPIDSMPRVLQFISYIVPAKYFLLIIRGIMLKGSDLSHLWEPALSLAVMTTVLLAVSIKRFATTLER
jgi:ABC-2 type transport system permease protein